MAFNITHLTIFYVLDYAYNVDDSCGACGLIVALDRGLREATLYSKQGFVLPAKSELNLRK